ncbi:NADPH2:quinone reductase [Saccharopolyspora antimicrobica]|uniref:NADPH2:quinone reductase n=1 Tax=Saccharopolyspora antimicrobica TaxID=455193 RepID=A0A1I5IDV5_9PSEU|nr:zinc-binding dehydrogenase [Saccharopolyspora antimicrobica]RKT85512.1 NADPH2:quinone reductase [Saccharopolyspora antimicrobica]SFO58795.1 NADPH2:quinone reductase [Saccharopolyspora antimicrobica]
MRAVEVTRFGGPEVLSVVEAAAPEPGPAQVVVRMSAVDVLFLDTQLRGGWGEDFFGFEPPYVPGDGVAGEVVAFGADVDPSWLGRTVVAGTGNSGTYAELVAVDEAALIAVPDGLTAHEAASLLHDGATAVWLAEAASIRPGDRVLVTTAVGGAGSLLVQLARAAGAQVVGLARGEVKLELVRSFGADAVDYTDADWVEQVRELAGGGVDVVLDGAGGRTGSDAFGAVNDGARVFTYGAPGGDFAEYDEVEAKRRELTVVGLLDEQPDAEGLRAMAARALAEAAAGRIKPTIGRTFPLERAADAHASVEARTSPGRTLLVA